MWIVQNFINCYKTDDGGYSNSYWYSSAGVSHGQELQYVFGYPFLNQTYIKMFGVYPRQEYDIDFTDRNISEYMITLFTNYSTFG